MDQNEEKILRKYLKRRIAEKNLVFSRMSYSFKEEAKSMRYNIFNSFARGANNTFDMTPSNLNFKAIRSHIESTGNKLSPYNYFDLDTLIAYDTYLGTIINHINLCRMQDQRQYFLRKDFSTAIDYYAPRFFLKNDGTFDTGFYDLKCPIKVLRDENNRLAPERTPDAKAFENKYPVSMCEELLATYLEEKHPTKQKEVQELVEQFDFIYNGVKYNIESEDYYLDENSYPIKYIVARAVDDQYQMVRGFFDMEMTEYVGDVYSLDNNCRFLRDESGVTEFIDPDIQFEQ